MGVLLVQKIRRAFKKTKKSTLPSYLRFQVNVYLHSTYLGRPRLVEHRVKPCEERIIHHTPQYGRAMIAVQPTETNAPTLRIWTTFTPCLPCLTRTTSVNRIARFIRFVRIARFPCSALRLCLPLSTPADATTTIATTMSTTIAAAMSTTIAAAMSTTIAAVASCAPRSGAH